MTREKRPFVPANPQRITMYVCGPTVYGRAHIGNARPAVVFDTLARLIRHEFGAKSLVYARNVTDVDDKIIASAEKEGVDPSVITKRYEDFIYSFSTCAQFCGIYTGGFQDSIRKLLAHLQRSVFDSLNC